MTKVYLSAAAHATDNKTKCPATCGENLHCGKYMDIVEARLKEQGVQVKRGFVTQTGAMALKNRVKEANAWKADVYYVAHTNAGGGRYSMTMCYPDAASKAKANVFHKYRRCVSAHKVKTRSDLYEINATKMPCLYDELIFHDNATDCKWFHDGGMEKLAEETVQALCELCGVRYAPKVDKSAAKAEKKPVKGDAVTLKKDRLYLSSTGKSAVIRTGTFYVYDGLKINGRYRVTNKASRVGKTPMGFYVSGWVEL